MVQDLSYLLSGDQFSPDENYSLIEGEVKPADRDDSGPLPETAGKPKLQLGTINWIP